MIEFREGHAKLRVPLKFHVSISIFQPFGQEGELLCRCAPAFPRHGRVVFDGCSPRPVVQSIVPLYGPRVHERSSVVVDRKTAVLFDVPPFVLVACVCL